MNGELKVNGTVIKVSEPDQVFLQIVPEIEVVYRFDRIEFRPGDVVLDVGAHKGIVSIYLAKLNPGITIHAYEPVAANFAALKANLRGNGITNVHPHKLAVNADARYMSMAYGHHSAEATAFFDNQRPMFRARATTIPAILRRHGIERVRLLKLDCEGAEHEILAHSEDWMDRIDHVRGEIHLTPLLRNQGYSMEATMAKVPSGRAEWQVVET